MGTMSTNYYHSSSFVLQLVLVVWSIMLLSRFHSNSDSIEFAPPLNCGFYWGGSRSCYFGLIHTCYTAWHEIDIAQMIDGLVANSGWNKYHLEQISIEFWYDFFWAIQWRRQEQEHIYFRINVKTQNNSILPYLQFRYKICRMCLLNKSKAIRREVVVMSHT